MLHEHLAGQPLKHQILDFSPPFSCFDLVDTQFGGNSSIRRCLSLARSFSAQTLVIEDIQPAGVILEENEDLSISFPHFQPGGLRRISFWRKDFKTYRGLDSCKADDLIGYVIAKQDINRPLLANDVWHIFEAVIRKYPHLHNCIPNVGDYQVSILGRKYSVPGVLYCQQNGLNKACAHVAVRSLVSRLNPGDPISYRTFNQIAQSCASKSNWKPAQGLSVQQIRAILDHYGVQYNDVDYEAAFKAWPKVQEELPYQKFLYAGIESGCGGLLGFSMSGPGADKSKHIIPFFGHTFNKDTWAPDADVSYFNIGGGVGYVPSESWTSSFIGHDDNLGPNFCVPRLYVKPCQVQYVVELMQKGVNYSGTIAEAQSLQFIYSMKPQLDTSNPWTSRLAFYSDPQVQRVILRTVSVKKELYLAHLHAIEDWQANTENPAVIRELEPLLSNQLWVVEISIPQLFPANERKLGDIVLNADQICDIEKEVDYSLFLFARVPGEYLCVKSVNQYGPIFDSIKSKIQSHVELLHVNGSSA